ncbi:lipopolysaccharide biosynthesis protein [Paenimyroides aestuarii]|uniref:Polysaccharide biosynthesis protein n=1 Tax=Paenimyroides aestuarii TaxID=2968490 RepID=A0ABY5NS15_9FLAO|nr:hypothetical protein [Paenimyroides aestuarii]UUV21274.1 hypothetical protein NPX36_13240 [Paenimyroides aestuarii]
MFKFFNKTVSILKNKNVIYLLTRYLTYGIQFFVSIFIAVALGPYYFGIWGFILLIINYFGVLDFGFANAVNILIIKNKENLPLVRRYFSTGFILVSFLNILVLIFFLYNYFFLPIKIFSKYNLNNEIWLLGLIALNVNYNNLLMHLYRINNKLSQISFYQSIVPIFMLVVVMIFHGEKLLKNLILCYVIGNLSSTLYFLKGKVLPSLQLPPTSDFKEVMKRGFFLFLYNVSFYLIVLSLRSFISAYYSVEEFGLFAFAFTLGNSILLFLQAISFLIYPKVVSILNTLNENKVLESLQDIRRVYLTLTYLMLYIGLAIISYGIVLIPEYTNSFKLIGLCSLTIVLYSNSFGYGTFLIANGYEKLNALISISCLLLNIFLCYIFIVILKFSYELVIFATMISYFVYTYLTVSFTKKKINCSSRKFLNNLKDCFGFNILIPYVFSLFLIVFNLDYLIILPLCIFLVLSVNDIKFLVEKMINIIKNNKILEI